MHIRKKIRNRLIIVVLVILAIIMWRGLTVTTKNTYECNFRVIYAVCTPKFKNAEFPSFTEIFKAGVTFNVSTPWTNRK